MANQLISQLLGESKFKIYDESTGLQVWEDLSVIAVSISSDAETARQPISIIDPSEREVYQAIIEDDVSNGKIIRPTSLTLYCMTADLSTMENIERKWSDITSSFSILSRSIISDHMIISQVVIDQTKDNISSQRITIKFEQSEPYKSTQFDPAADSDATTYGIRVQNIPETISEVVNGTVSAAQTTATRISNKLRTIYNKVFS